MKESGATRAAKAARTRDEILDAALACIAERGMSGSSSNEIARRAGISWGAIQHHFGGRAQLLHALIDRNFEHLLADVDAVAVSGRTVLERLQSLADVIWQYCIDPRYIVNWTILIESRQDPEIRAVQAERSSYFEAASAQLWERLFGVAGVAGDQVRFRLLFGALRGFALNRHTASYPSDFVQERALLVRLLAAEVGG